nr:MFS transporter [Spelaeicoccus albus]
MFACSWCGNQFSPLLLMYENVEHYSTVDVNAFLGVYVFGLAPALLAAGALSDRFGRRPLMIVAVVSSLAASLSLLLGEANVAGIYVGRLLSGVAVGAAMSVGTSWIKELSRAPFDDDADVGSGARRSSLAFTAGSATGALVAGGIAQFTAWGEELPFAVHVVMTAPLLFLIRRVPETVRWDGVKLGFRDRFRVPSASHRRFTRVVVVAAPWLFAAAALAYGYLPVLLADRTAGWGLGYAAILSVVTLGVASLVQPLAKRIDSTSNARGLVVCLAGITGGILVLTLAVVYSSPVIGLVAAVVFGIAMGIGLVSGLLEVQRIAPERELAGLTGVFYALAYAGFLTPTLLAAITPPLTTVGLFLGLAVLACASAAVIMLSYRKHLPENEAPANSIGQVASR